MAGKVTLLDVATTRTSVEVTGMIKVRDLLEAAGVDLSNSEQVTLRDVAEDKILELDDEVPDGTIVLLTRNIKGG